MVHILNGILFSHKKECIWVNSDKVGETWTYYTEWSESERERKISYSNAYIQNLENDTEEFIYRAAMEKQT